MKAFIYTGGAIFPENITERPNEGDLCIAADSGYKNACALGVKVNILLGDFDSLDADLKANVGDDIEVLTVPSEKDFTDTQMAVDTALDKGADEIVIIGGLSGRLDHTLSNLAVLEFLNEKKIQAIITDGKNRVRFIDSTSTLVAKSKFKYLSLIAKGKKVSGVTIEGCKYPLCDAKLTDSYQYAVSNEIVGNCAFISVKRGSVYIVESAE